MPHCVVGLSGNFHTVILLFYALSRCLLCVTKMKSMGESSPQQKMEMKLSHLHQLFPCHQRHHMVRKCLSLFIYLF